MRQIQVIVGLFILFAGAALSQSGQPAAYVVREGKNLFTDGTLQINFLGKTRKIDSLIGEFAFHENCKYDFRGDADQKDWNKLTGVQFWQGLKGLVAPNRDNIMIAWRYNVNGWFEVAPFVNKGKKWEIGKTVRVHQPYQKGYYQFIRNKKGQWSVSIASAGSYIYQTFAVNEKKRARLIPPWFGGADNDAAGLPYGGKAPHEMIISLSAEVKK